MRLPLKVSQNFLGIPLSVFSQLESSSKDIELKIKELTDIAASPGELKLELPGK